jgi:16S rRNA (uracil1498-N3)-methyltransferase
MAASMPDKQKWIAHCAEGPKNSLPDNPLSHSGDKIIVIGPEGDFTAEEIEKALAKQFIPVTLGANRLRTETAGVVAATLLCIN